MPSVGTIAENRHVNGPGQEFRYLLDLALDKSLEGRKALTATVGDLFGQLDNVLSERERELMSEILRKLIHDCEMAVRRDLSERLAKAPNPPHDLIVMLANDEIEVAEPILMKSEVLHDIELIRVIRHRTQQHQLVIAMRRSLSERVSDALVETGDVDVIKTLLENADAVISEAAMEYLTEESRRVDTYQEPLLRRDDLKPELAERMYLWVSAALRSHILENFDIQPGHLDDQLQGVARSIARDPEQHASVPDESNRASVLAARLAKQNKITPDFLVQVLRQGEVRLFEALFGELSGLRTPRLQSVLYDSGGDGLAVVCRVMEMPKPAFATIFLLSRRGRQGTRSMDPRELSRALLLFDKMDLDAAKEVVKGWGREWKYQDAIERIAAAPGKAPGSKQEAD